MKRILHRPFITRRALLPALAALLLTTSACQKTDEVPAPANLLPPDKMVSLLVELHTLEARTEAASLTADSGRALFRQEQKKVYWRYEISDSVFTQSFRYYATQGQELNKMYDAVVDSLAAQEK